MGNDNNACCSKNEEAPVAVFDLDTLIFKDVDFNKAETYKRLEKGTKEFLKKQNLTEQYVPLFSRIIANKQEHLIQAYKLLNTQKEKEKFLRSLESVDIQLVDSLFHNLINKIHRSSIQMVAKPCTFTEEALMSIKQKKGLFKKGLEMIQQRKVAIILLCGGSNTRFGGNIPKFLKQTNIPSKKCIMELLLIRLKKINYLANNNNDKDWSINIFIMCNQDNYQSIKQFLQKKKYCGIPQKYVHFFLQGSTPILNLKGQLCLNQQYKIIQSPNGSGQFLQTIVNFKMKNKIINQLGIQYLCISGLQNMLEIPCDPLLIGQMNQQNAQVIAKCTDIENQQQSFYRYVNINGKIKAVHPKRLEDFICYDIGKLQQSPIYMNSVIYDVMYLNKLLTSPQVRFQISRMQNSFKIAFIHRKDYLLILTLRIRSHPLFPRNVMCSKKIFLIFSWHLRKLSYQKQIDNNNSHLQSMHKINTLQRSLRKFQLSFMQIIKKIRSLSILCLLINKLNKLDYIQKNYFVLYNYYIKITTIQNRYKLMGILLLMDYKFQIQGIINMDYQFIRAIFSKHDYFRSIFLLCQPTYQSDFLNR